MKRNWSKAELRCLLEARKRKIQTKIIALALRRSVAAVTKQLSRLRNSQSKGAGRPVGIGRGKSHTQRSGQDFIAMLDILRQHAPLLSKYFTEQHYSFRFYSCIGASSPSHWKTGIWASALPIKSTVGGHKSSASSGKHKRLSHSDLQQMRLQKLLETDLKTLDLIKSGRIIYQNQLSVELSLVENWAGEQGISFRKIDHPIYRFEYAVDGKYLTKGQFIVHVNKERIAQQLVPFHLEEADESSFSE